MPRRARMYIPGLPYHIVQRGNNREACFVEAENYQYYLGLWKTCARRYGVSVHAYCLMTNHIHFLITPETEESISKAMRVVGSRYAYYFNRLDIIIFGYDLGRLLFKALNNPVKV